MTAADIAAKERARRPSGENVKRVDPQQALSELDQRIEKQRREDSARRLAAGSTSPNVSPSGTKPRAYSASSGKNSLFQFETDMAAKDRARPTATPASGVSTDLSQVERDVASKASSRRAAAGGLTMAPGCYQVQDAPSASAYGTTATDANIKTSRRNELSQMEMDVASKARKSPVGSCIAVPYGGAERGHVASLTALEADVEAKSRGTTTPHSMDSRPPAPQVVVSVSPDQAAIEEQRIACKTGIHENQGQESNTKIQESRQCNKDGSVQGDLNALERSKKDMSDPRRDYNGIGGANTSFDANEHLTVAVAIEEEDEDKFIASAVEYDPDSKPPIYKNRRFRWYGGLGGVVLLGLILGLYFGLLSGDEGKTLIEDDSTSPPTSYRELGIQQTIEWVVPSDKLYDPSSHHYRALQWILHEDPKALEPEDLTLTQRYILALFYFQTSEVSPWYFCAPPDLDNGDDPVLCFVKEYRIKDEELLFSSTRWLSEVDECRWAGIDCNDVDQVIAIHLPNQKMAGTLPSEIAVLPLISSIGLHLNRFTGTLPSEWGEMNHLIYIEVHNNTLTGTIPETWWDRSATMTRLNVGGNELSGSIPGDRLGDMRALRSLFLGGNRFTGTIPTEVGLLTKLVSARLDDNFLAGTLPTEFGQLKKVKEFWLQRLRLTGTIPSEMANMESLVDFRIHSNGLNGTVPEDMYSLLGLTRFEIFKTNIGGTISTEVGNLVLLRDFLINDCEFHGTIPTEMGLLPRLEEVWLQGNDLTGSIPEVVCSNSQFLDELAADCLNSESTGLPAVSCAAGCCTKCCDTETGLCDNQ